MRERKLIDTFAKNSGAVRDYALGHGATTEQLRSQLQVELLEKLDFGAQATKPRDEFAQAMRDQLAAIAEENKLSMSPSTRDAIFERIVDDMLGLGPLEKILEDPLVSDILINGAKNIFVERNGKLSRSNVTFENDEHLMRVIQRIVAKVGRQVDDLHAMVDARLEDGSRFNAIIPPLALDGPAVSIRRFGTLKVSDDSLVEKGSLPREVMELIGACVKMKLNIVISGGTGSGKTTLLNVMSGFIPPHERIITIEDSAELQLQQPHTIRLETRNANLEGVGEVDSGTLLSQALRMRPDRIILGEIRGAEAVDMLQAMNTGNDGSMATVHANSPQDALSRFETMVSMSMPNMSDDFVRSLIAASLDVIVQLNRLSDGSRRTMAVTEVLGIEDGVILTRDLCRFYQEGVEDGKITGHWHLNDQRPSFMPRAKKHGIEISPDIFGMKWGIGATGAARVLPRSTAPAQTRTHTPAPLVQHPPPAPTTEPEDEPEDESVDDEPTVENTPA